MTTNAGASLTSTEVLPSSRLTLNAVAREASSVCSPRTISSSGSTATGLKKWNPTTRSGCFRSEAISVTDSEEVLVSSRQVSETTASTSAKTVFLTDISSKTASITTSASAKSALSVEPRTRDFSRLAPLSLSRPLPSSLSISAWT